MPTTLGIGDSAISEVASALRLEWFRSCKRLISRSRLGFERRPSIDTRIRFRRSTGTTSSMDNAYL